MGTFRSDYRDVPEFGRKGSSVKQVSGHQAASDAKRGIRSDKNGAKRFKPDKPSKKTPPPSLSGGDKRRFEQIARKRESGEQITSSDKSFLKSKGYKA